ncbi:primosomal protein N' [bacterium]|nr:primosomal protein N' [bacterium]
MKRLYADIVIPVAVSGSFTYAIPEEIRDLVRRGSLVTVPFGQSKSAAGMVVKVHDNPPEEFSAREIGAMLPGEPALNERLTDFLMWVSDYYMAYPGEVMKAAIPVPEDLPGRPVKRKRKEKPEAEAAETVMPAELNRVQGDAHDSIRRLFAERDTVLLHGVTSSGKTEIYIHLMREQLDKGRQVLYMLPEIALTTQIIERLRKHFGNAIGVFHSRLTPAARREVWKKVSEGSLRAVLGVRSSLFLPFSDLGLIIVDEEHDSSYKQYDPAPRYHARDAAMMLARLHGGKTLLGSATPSLESYHNALAGRYGFVELMVRFGEVMMPEMIIADTRRGGKKNGPTAHFTPRLLDAVEEALKREEQVILFQNRRGFSPFLMCSDCGHVPACTNCSVSYTYHKGINRLVCHYCGKSVRLPSECPECGSVNISTMGFGTEKIEEEIKMLFPSARVARMDQDTVRKRNAASDILGSFAAGETDILIGTQMISKGLDFERLTVVGILDADNMMHFPDFRAHERSFQLMEQVSGRAGRRTRRGKVIIQTADPANMILRHVLKHDYRSMSTSQLEERALFGYPPFTRIIRIALKHRDLDELNATAARLAGTLRRHLGNHVLGPEFPMVMQVQKWYIKTIMIKIDSTLSPSKVKEMVRREMEAELKSARRGLLRIHADVDPQ